MFEALYKNGVFQQVVSPLLKIGPINFRRGNMIFSNVLMPVWCTVAALGYTIMPLRYTVTPLGYTVAPLGVTVTPLGYTVTPIGYTVSLG